MNSMEYGKPSIQSIQDQIITEMSNLDGELDRYKYLITLAKNHKPDASLYSEENRIPGCQSNSWLRSKLEQGKLQFEADSESMIIRGIIVLLLKVWNGRTPVEVTNTELTFLESQHIMGSLSPTKDNGLHSIIHQFKVAAEGFI